MLLNVLLPTHTHVQVVLWRVPRACEVQDAMQQRGIFPCGIYPTAIYRPVYLLNQTWCPGPQARVYEYEMPFGVRRFRSIHIGKLHAADTLEI